MNTIISTKMQNKGIEMIDTIHLNKRAHPEELFQDSFRKRWYKKVNKKRKRDYYSMNLSFGKHKAPITIKYDTIIESVKLEFSLHKYLYGENYRNYNPIERSAEILKSINNDVEEFLQVDLNDFNVNRVDFGINIRTEFETEHYIKNFDTLLPKRIGRKTKTWYENGTLMINDNTTSMLFYDKVKELNWRNISKPNLGDVVRVEFQLKNTQGLLAAHRFSTKIKFEEIFDVNIYYKLFKLLFDNFNLLFPFTDSIHITDIVSILEYLNDRFSKECTTDVFRLLQGFQNQTTSMNLIEKQINQANRYPKVIRKKILNELRVILISNTNLGYRRIVKEIHTKVLKEMKKQRKGVRIN